MSSGALPGLFRPAVRMMYFSYITLSCMCLLALSACSAQSVLKQEAPAGISVAGMIIRNELPYPVTDVMINVPATGAFAGCGNIMSRTNCRTSFESIDYSGHAMVVSWKEYGEEKSTAEFVVKPEADFDHNRLAWLEVTIFSAGQAGAKFIQNAE